MNKYSLIVFPLVIFDLVSKFLANRYLIKDYYMFNNQVGLELTYNTGIAWGFLSGHARYTLILSFGVLIWLVREIVINDETENTLPLYLILSGALGNIIERTYGLIMGNNGRVTDFFVLGPIPNFNIADALISIGLAYLIYTELRSVKK